VETGGVWREVRICVMDGIFEHFKAVS
jgi:hypothetical protein